MKEKPLPLAIREYKASDMDALKQAYVDSLNYYEALPSGKKSSKHFSPLVSLPPGKGWEHYSFVVVDGNNNALGWATASAPSSLEKRKAGKGILNLHALVHPVIRSRTINGKPVALELVKKVVNAAKENGEPGILALTSRIVGRSLSVLGFEESAENKYLLKFDNS